MQVVPTYMDMLGINTTITSQHLAGPTRWLFIWLLVTSSLASQAQVIKQKVIFPNSYVLLSDSAITVHHVRAYRPAERADDLSPQLATLGGRGPAADSIEFLNVLVPGRQLRQLSAGPDQTAASAVFAPTDTLLISLGILPIPLSDTYTPPGARLPVRWQPVRLDTLGAGQVVSLRQFVLNGAARVQAYRQAGSPGEHALIARDDIRPIIWRQGRYWVARAYVITEYFQVRPRPDTAFNATDAATINVQGSVLRKEELLRMAQQANPRMQLRYLVAGNTLQGRRGSAYEFWTNPATVVSDYRPLHEGVGEFLYQPGIGLISGKYRAYFSNFGVMVSDKFPGVVSIDDKLFRK